MTGAIDGRWDCVIRTPLGNQRGVLSVTTAGDRFEGELSGALGSKAIQGQVEGPTIRWNMQPGSTLPFAVECRATAQGDRLEGEVTAATYGSFPLSGTRVTGE